jgi:hypothetical protein
MLGLGTGNSSPVTGEDAETLCHGDAESPRSTCDAGHEASAGSAPALFGVNVQGFEAPTKSLIWSPEIRRGLNPCLISLPASPPLRVPASLNSHQSPFTTSHV